MYQEILPKQELTRLKRAFALFDVDGDGTVSEKVMNIFICAYKGSMLIEFFKV